MDSEFSAKGSNYPKCNKIANLERQKDQRTEIKRNSCKSDKCVVVMCSNCSNNY